MPDHVSLPEQELPRVQETALSKSLVFSDLDIQSRMSVARPNELQFEYTRLMMAALLFYPQPLKILMVGLGGGSMAKFCFEHLTTAHITVVEINPHVIALRQDFGVPDDGPRFVVVQMDAADFVAQTNDRFDVIFVDGFDRQGLPEQLCSPQFYADCRQALTPNGLVVANLHRFSQYLDIYIDRITSVFEHPPWVIHAPGTTNSIAFATKEPTKVNQLTFSSEKPPHLTEDAWRQVRPSLARVFLAIRHSA